MLCAWSADLAELWELAGLFSSTRAKRPCPRCILTSEHISTLPMVEQRNAMLDGKLLRTAAAMRLRITETQAMSATAGAAHLHDWSIRTNDNNVFLEQRFRFLDICQDADFDELHIVWSGWVADIHEAIQKHVLDNGGQAKADELDRRLAAIPPFPHLLNLAAYSGKAHTAKVYETLLQVILFYFFLSPCF